MELRHLRYFVVVAEELNFRRAAERLNISRPALSKQIRDLEEEIGVTLMERNTVRVALTEAGKTYLVDARAILSHVERAQILAREVQSGRRGHLLIASVGPIAAGFMPEAVKSFGEEFPDVDVGFVEMSPPEQLDALANGLIHIGFAYGKKAMLPRGLKSMRILQSKFAVAMYHGHPLADRTNVTLGDISRETLLCLGRESDSKHCRDIRVFFAAEGVTHGPARYIQGFDSLLTMIAANQGVALMPRIIDLNRVQGIVLKPLVTTRAEIDFSMWAVWKSEEASPLVGKFLQRLRERLPVPFKTSAGIEGAA
jgi:DNA-binding transcriptional LysR family regulator